jgi:hypothetical protein
LHFFVVGFTQPACTISPILDNISVESRQTLQGSYRQALFADILGQIKKITPTDTDININQKTMKENFGERPWDN